MILHIIRQHSHKYILIIRQQPYIGPIIYISSRPFTYSILVREQDMQYQIH